MAQVEQMDIDDIESDFDNKENTFHHSNVPSRTPCTEKGYEELDVSELNMKLRYSMTPTVSPMSKSFTGPYLDNRNSNPVEDFLNNTVGLENCNLTRSLNSTLTKTENIVKVKGPLQTIATDPLVDSYRISSMRRQSDATNDNMTITVSNANDIDENSSLPSTCSSVVVTPEATTPIKEIPKSEGSPILRGLKSVLSMFRPSQSPIPPADDSSQKQEILSPVDSLTTPHDSNSGFCNLASTPVSDKQKETLRSSPLKESIVFNEDLEKELLWNDETTIIFKDEKIPVHKLFFQTPLPSVLSKKPKGSTHHNTTVEYMDISCDESILEPKTTKEIDSNSHTTKKEAAVESDNEFLDCETTIIKDESYVSDYNEMECEKEIQTRDLPDDGSSKINESMSQKVLNDADCSKPSEESSNQTLQIQGITYLESHVTENNSYPITKISSEKAVISFANSETEGSLHTTLDQSSEIKSGTASEMVGNNHLTSVESSDAATENITDSTLKNGNMVCNNFINEPGSLLAQNKNDNSLSEYKVTNDDNINVKEPIDVKLIDNEGQFDKLEAHPHHACEIINNLPPAEFNDTVDDKHHRIVFEELTDVVNSTDVYADSLNNCDYSEGAFEGNACYESLQVINHSPGVEDVTLTKNAFDCNNEIKKIETVNIAESPMKQIESNLMNLENNFKNDILVDMCSKITMDIECLKESAFIPQNLESNPSILINPYSMVNSEDHSPNMLVQHIADNNRSKELNDNAEENIPCSLEPTLTSTTTVPNDENHINVCDDNIGTATLCKITSIESQNNTEVSATCVVLDNDHDINELTTGKEMTHQITSSQTLLPNNDVSIQNIAEPDTAEYKEAVNTGDVTFEISEKMDFENIDSSSIKNEIKRKSVVHLIPQHDTKTNEDKTSGQDEVIEVEVCKENITHYETNKNIEIPDVRFAQQQENLLQYRFEDDRAEICKKNVISECQSSAKIHSEKGTVLESVGRDNIPIQTIFVKTNNSGDITDLKMLDNTTSVKKNIQQSMPGTEVGEIITSANNSPYVPVINPDRDVTETLHEPLEKIDSSFVTNNKIESSPISPKIVSKGYNYNFDEMDDPFATKTKIRTSPTPNSPDQSSFAYDNDIKILGVPKKIDNRRKSQSDKNRLTSKKNSSNSTKLNGRKNIPDRNNYPINRPQDNNISCMPAKENPGKNVRKVKEADSVNQDSKDQIHETQIFNEESKCPKQDNNISCMETPAKENPGENVRKVNNEADSINQDSKDQIHETQKLNEGSKCLKQEGEGVMNRFKNVFNLPEIDDINFNPFATKSKMCEYSPPPTDKPLKTIESASTNSPLLLQEQQSVNYTTAINEFSFDKDITKDLSPNTSDATSTSKNSNDENTTVREVLTEDEDTLEGPFLESEDLKETDKLTDVNVDPDMINFDDVIQDRDDEFGNNEIFIDAQTFEFLLNKKSTTVLDSGKESLFLKFDPLFAKRVSSDGVLAALSQAQRRQSTPNKVTKPKEHTKTKENTNIENPVAGPSNISEKEFLFVECNEDLSSTNTKPVMVVNPAVSSGVSQRKSIVTPNLNRRSLSFTSPAMAVIDRLISLSGNSSFLDQNSSLANVSAENIPDTNSAITHLREMLAEKEINVQNMRSESKELKNRLAALEVQVKHLEKESTERLHKINELNERLSEKSKINKSMTTVVEEYEKTIASLISDTEQDKKRHAEERMRLMKERDEQTAHLTNMEVSFNDLHSKYEKSKQIILGYKANEDMYKKTIKEFEGNFAKMQNNYELLKQHATSKLNHANQELEKINRSHEAEVLKYNAMIKRKDMDISSLEETLAQKTKTNKELTAICDELINKVGR